MNGIIKEFSGLLIIVLMIFSGCGAREPGASDLEAGIRALEQGRNEHSLRLFQRVIARAAGTRREAMAHNFIGVAHWRLGRRDLAVLAFETSADLDPLLVEPLYNLGVAMAEREKKDEAIAFFERAAAVDPDDTRALEYLSHYLRTAGDAEGARRAMEEALARAPRSKRIITALAVLDFEKGDAERAAAGFQHALEHDAAYAPAIFNLGVVNRRLIDNGVQAAAYFEEYARLFPESPRAERARAALEDIERVEDPAEQPEDAPTRDEYMRMAMTLEQQGRVEAAVHNYLRAVFMAEDAGAPALREEALNRAVSAAGNDARAHHALGGYFLERQMGSRAVAHFKRAAELKENWADPLMDLAGILVEKGEIDAAIVCLKQADSAEPDNPDALWSLARLYERQTGLTGLAIECYSRFVRRFPDDPRVKQARKRLKALE